MGIEVRVLTNCTFGDEYKMHNLRAVPYIVHTKKECLGYGIR
jgi:hypothetical protein